ncbi:MAG: DNA-formamidopyrimidine glycosylase family protein [Planctomycetota bacterium]|jgi:endonuclease-8
MSEGPQVKLVTERLRRQLQGKTISQCATTRPNLKELAGSVVGSTARRIFSKGKHIFFDFGSGRFLNNHLLMRGRWRSTADRFLLLPPEIWIAFEVGNCTIYNYMGQVLRILDERQMRACLDSLGPDIMCEDCTEKDVVMALAHHEKPLGEVLLDQAVLSGIGNVAKSESLFLAGIDPQAKTNHLTEDKLARLANSIMRIMWDSYNHGGRWTHRVYRRAGKQCFECGTRISMIRQGKQRRSTYFCPMCQPRG